MASLSIEELAEVEDSSVGGDTLFSGLMVSWTCVESIAAAVILGHREVHHCGIIVRVGKQKQDSNLRRWGCLIKYPVNSKHCE